MNIEDGKYPAKAISWEFGQTAKGENQIGILFALSEAPDTRLTYYGNFGDKSLPHTMKALRACGWKGSDLADLFGGQGGLDTNEVLLVVENEEWQGKVRAKIKWVNPLGGVSMANPLDQAGIKAFAASMKAKIVALDPASAKVKAAPKSVPTKPTSGDDIPF